MATQIYREMLTEAALSLGAEIRWCEDQPTGRSVGFVTQGLLPPAVIYGNAFPLNLYGPARLANDKVMAYWALDSAGIPAIPHYAVDGFPAADPGEMAAQIADQYGFPVVIKPFDGTNGNGVERFVTTGALAAHLAAERQRGCTQLAASPWQEITTEYRAIILDGVVLLRYSKRRPEGQWRHNLAKGAQPELYDMSHPLAGDVDKLALAAAERIGLRFCSADVAETPCGLKIMEVNAGVSLDQIAAMNPEYRAKATEIFRTALDHYLTGSHRMPVEG